MENETSSPASAPASTGSSTSPETGPSSAPSTASPASPATGDSASTPASGLSDLFDQIERGGSDPAIEVQKAEVAAKQPKRGREYADDEERQLFSNMSNEAYARLYPEWKKIKSGEYVPKGEIEKARAEAQAAQAKAVQQVRWDDHPKAYTLTEEYDDINDNKALYGDVMQHYQQALAAVEAGKPFYRVIPDDKQKFVIDQKQVLPPGPEAKAFIIAQLQRFGGLQMQNDAKLEALKSSSTTQFSQVKEAMEKADKDIFGPIAANPNFEAAWKKELEIFPAALRNTLQYQLLAKASVVIKAINSRGVASKQAAVANSTQPQGIAGATSNPDQRKQIVAQLDAMASR